MELKTELKQKENSTVEYRKIHGIHKNESFTLTVPKNLILELGIENGDYVKCKVEDRKLVVQRAD